MSDYIRTRTEQALECTIPVVGHHVFCDHCRSDMAAGFLLLLHTDRGPVWNCPTCGRTYNFVDKIFEVEITDHDKWIFIYGVLVGWLSIAASVAIFATISYLQMV